MIYLYYTFKAFLICFYISINVYGAIYFFSPIIDAYGWADVVLTWIALFISGFASTYFFFATTKPSRPMASPRS